MYKDPMLWRYPEEIRSISTPGGTVTTLWSQSSPRSTNESETWTPYSCFLTLPRRSHFPSNYSFNDFPSLIIAARKTVWWRSRIVIMLIILYQKSTRVLISRQTITPCARAAAVLILVYSNRNSKRICFVAVCMILGEIRPEGAYH